MRFVKHSAAKWKLWMCDVPTGCTSIILIYKDFAWPPHLACRISQTLSKCYLYRFQNPDAQQKRHELLPAPPSTTSSAHASCHHSISHTSPPPCPTTCRTSHNFPAIFNSTPLPLISLPNALETHELNYQVSMFQGLSQTLTSCTSMHRNHGIQCTYRGLESWAKTTKMRYDVGMFKRKCLEPSIWSVNGVSQIKSKNANNVNKLKNTHEK